LRREGGTFREAHHFAETARTWGTHFMKSDCFGKTQLLTFLGCGENPHRKSLSCPEKIEYLVIIPLPGYGEERNLPVQESLCWCACTFMLGNIL
jgi:hypothetical protein